MTGILIVAILVALGIGFYLGREVGKTPGASPCPKCRQKRFYYCGSCGVHFDEGDQTLSHQEHPTWMDKDSVPEDNPRR